VGEVVTNPPKPVAEMTSLELAVEIAAWTPETAYAPNPESEATMTTIANYLRSLFVVLVHNSRRLLVILTAWAIIALIVWDYSPLAGSYAAGVEFGALFALLFFGGFVTTSFVRDVIRQTAPR
jgi:hypothetical protein